jgi:hypothetical protein
VWWSTHAASHGETMVMGPEQGALGVRIRRARADARRPLQRGMAICSAWPAGAGSRLAWITPEDADLDLLRSASLNWPRAGPPAVSPVRPLRFLGHAM